MSPQSENTPPPHFTRRESGAALGIAYHALPKSQVSHRFRRSLMTPSLPQPPDHSRSLRAIVVRVCLVLSLAIYSAWGSRLTAVIIHDHDGVHHGNHGELHHAPDPHHDDHHDGEEGEHHHHLSCVVSVAMVPATPLSHTFFQRVIKLRPTSLDEKCPSGPVFEMIKPPQVS